MENTRPMVRFKRITAETVIPICKLSDTLASAQRRMVADNAISIAQAHFCETAWFRAIYAGDTPVGFIMVNFSANTKDGVEREEAYLWRFMIAGPYQDTGYGRQTLDLLVALVKEKGYNELYVSCGEGEGSPRGFYEKYGFVPTGEIDDGETVLIYRFSA